MKLSILICTIPERKKQFTILLNRLFDMSIGYDVEILFNSEERFEISGMKVGDKRQKLMQRAKGKYIVWIDDDDDVSDDFVHEIMKAINTGTDAEVICYKQLAIIDGKEYVIDWSIHNEIEQLHDNGDVKRKPSVPATWLRTAALRGTFPSKNVDEDSEWAAQVNPQSEYKIDKVLHKYIFSSTNSAASTAKRVAVVSFASGDYVPLIERQRAKIKEFSNYDYFCFNDFGQIQSKPHSEYPYAFKPNAIHTVQKMGYNVILWIDSPLYPVRNFDFVIEKIVKDGILLVNNIGWQIGDFTSDICLAHLGLTRDESFLHPMVMACIMGFDLRDDKIRNIFDTYLGFAHTNAYQGDWHNDKLQVSTDARVRGHRHDQSVISCIAAKRGIELTHPKEIIAYKNEPTHREWVGDSVFISDRTL